MALDPRLGGRPQGNSQTGEHMGAGLQFAASIIGFLLLGMWLDGRLGTEPWLLVAGVVIGSCAGFWSMYRHLVILPRERVQKDKP